MRFEDDDWGALVTGASRPRVGEVLLAPAAHVARVGDRRRDRCRRRPVGRRRPPCTLRGFQGLSWVLAGPLEGDDGALEVAAGGGQGTARSRRLGVDDRGAILYRSRIGGLSFSVQHPTDTTAGQESPPTFYYAWDSLYRRDRAGNVMYWPSYGKHTPMGWEVDHSHPAGAWRHRLTAQPPSAEYRRESPQGQPVSVVVAGPASLEAHALTRRRIFSPGCAQRFRGSPPLAMSGRHPGRLRRRVELEVIDLGGARRGEWDAARVESPTNAESTARVDRRRGGRRRLGRSGAALERSGRRPRRLQRRLVAQVKVRPHPDPLRRLRHHRDRLGGHHRRELVLPGRNTRSSRRKIRAREQVLPQSDQHPLQRAS